ncbi:MAG TPA: glycosyltransferase family 2 protein, partial [Allocoleopsis sp.]
MITIEAIAKVTNDLNVIIALPQHIQPGNHKMVLTIDEQLLEEQKIQTQPEQLSQQIESSLNPLELSIVIPCYNEETNIKHLFERLFVILNKLNMPYEIICIDDGSSDNTLKCLLDYHQGNSAIKIISFSRNFGKEIALTAGLDFAQGKAVIPIDADLQDPPELIVKLVEKWQEGYDVVYAVRTSRNGETWLKRFTAHAFYKIIGKISKIYIPQNTGDFRLLDYRVVESLKKLPERTRFMKGLFAWVGHKQTYIEFERLPRLQGNT